MTEQWVADKLHDIVGMSDKTIAEFLVGLAKKSSSEDGLINAMRQTGVIEVDTKVVSFARELYQKVNTFYGY
jgi:pre-mRNA-splicing factor ATP-dependent RNA helicase DHX16